MIRVSIAAATSLVAAPRAALACAVCSPGQNDPSQTGFLIGTALLSVLPLIFIGSVVLWLFRRAKRMAQEEAAGLGPSAHPLPIPTAPAPPAAR